MAVLVALPFVVAVSPAVAADVVAATGGPTWGLQPVATPLNLPQGRLEGVACAPGTTSCVAVGSAYDSAGRRVPLVERRVAGSWSVDATVLSPPGAVDVVLSGVACTSAASCIAVGAWRDAGQTTTSPLAERWDGSRWSLLLTPPLRSGALLAVSCAGPLACVAVGRSGDFATPATLAEVWNGVVWTVRPTPAVNGATSAVLNGVACSTPGSCVAVGDSEDANRVRSPLAERWNGISWTLLAVPVPAGATETVLNGVSCSSASACTAVGFLTGERIKAESVAERWDGTSWTAEPGVGRNLFAGVSCLTDTWCSAVGDAGFGPLAAVWLGTDWTAETVTAPADGVDNVLAAVSCAAVSDCTAVGSYVTRPGFTVTYAVRRTAGGAWSIETTPNPPGATVSGLSTVSCSSARACFAGGSYTAPDGSSAPLLERFSNGRWTQQPVTAPGGIAVDGGVSAISCLPSGWCLAVASGFVPGVGWTAYSLRWDGTSWTSTTMPDPGDGGTIGFGGLSCTAPDACTAAGGYVDSNLGQGETLVERWDGASWTVQPTPAVPAALYGAGFSSVSCASATSCTAVGAYNGNVIGTLAEHWDGTAWTLQPTPDPAGSGQLAVLAGVSCTAVNACVAVGDYNPAPAPHPGVAFAERWDGTSWTLQSVPAPGDKEESPLADVSCTAADDCTAVGFYVANDGRFLTMAMHWNGATWTAVRTPNPPGAVFTVLGSVSCPMSQACTAVGAQAWDSGFDTPLAMQQGGA